MKPQRILPADVYDTLEFSSLVFGGIGAPAVFKYENGEQVCPVCLLGHALWATGRGVSGMYDNPIIRRMKFLGEQPGQVSDATVEAINSRKGRPNLDARVSWEEYCAELNIVRGES